MEAAYPEIDSNASSFVLATLHLDPEPDAELAVRDISVVPADAVAMKRAGGRPIDLADLARLESEG